MRRTLPPAVRWTPEAGWAEAIQELEEAGPREEEGASQLTSTRARVGAGREEARRKRLVTRGLMPLGGPQLLLQEEGLQWAAWGCQNQDTENTIHICNLQMQCDISAPRRATSTLMHSSSIEINFLRSRLFAKHLKNKKAFKSFRSWRNEFSVGFV